MLTLLASDMVFGFLLVFTRVGAIFMLLPGFSERYVPANVRLGLALAVSLIIYPLVRSSLPAVPDQPLILFFMLASEVLIGVMIGLIIRLVMSAPHVAGVIIAFNTSLAFAQTVDPNQGAQGALISAFLGVLATTLVFVSGLHVIMLMAVRDSYELFPPGMTPPADDLARTSIRMVSGSFKIGVQMAAPFIVYGITFYMALGMMQRLMPQLQLFFIALPLQILLGFTVFALVIPASLSLFLGYFEETTSSLLATP